MKRATIVHNPRARNAQPIDRLRAAAAALEPHGWQVDVQVTAAAGDATLLAAKAAAASASVVFASGGDGTVNEVVNGLVGSEAALALVRGGMGDVFAKEIRVPKPPEAALRVLIEGEERLFDLGRANERYFLVMAGVGFDATVVQRVPAGPKRVFGSTAYALWGLRELGRYQSQRVNLSLDGQAWESDLYWLLLGNTRSYGGVLNITDRALADDGLLDAYIFTGRGLAWSLSMGLRIAVRRHERATGVSFQRLRSLEVITAGLPVQGDGEYFGDTPMSFSVSPLALKVLVPPGGGEALLHRPDTSGES